MSFVADLRYSARALRRSPGFTLSAALVLGLAIGACAAAWTVADRVMFSDLPYPHAGRLVRVFQQSSPTNRFGLSTVEVQAIQQQQRSFEAFGAVQFGFGAMSGSDRPQTILIARATSGLFDALEVQPEAGRLLTAQDELPGAAPVAVVTDAIARQSLGGLGNAVGRSISLDAVPHTIVGVLPPSASNLAGITAGAWTPLIFSTPTRRGPFGTRGFGRLREGVTLEQAAADLARVSNNIFEQWSSGFRDRMALLTPMPLRESIVGNADRQIVLFGAAAALVLLVAIANVATLQLVRASGRAHEISVRAALGAGQARLARVVASEGAVLTVLAGTAGVAVTWAGVRLVTIVAPTLPRVSEISLGFRGIVAVFALALVSGLLVSLSPVMAAAAGADTASLRASTNRTGSSRGTNRLRGLLVTAEFALALPLLLGAGLLLNSFMRIQRIDPGFDPEGAVAVRVTLPAARYPDDAALQNFWRRALLLTSDVPLLANAGLNGGLPPDLFGGTNNFNLVQKPVASGDAEYISPWSAADEGYFKAMGIPLVEGRLFAAQDSGNGAPVVIVSRAWAAKYFPGESVVGKQMISGGCYDCPLTTIVGVVGDVKYSGVTGDGEVVYNPIEQLSLPRSLNLVARTAGVEGDALRALRHNMESLDPELPVAEILLSDRMAAAVADPRRWTGMVGAFAGVAMLLAALGVFGLMSYAVRQRQREIGVRLALGAEPSAVIRMIVTRGMSYALAGTAIGVVLALLEARWLGAFLYDVRPSDPLTLLGSATLLLLAAALASWIPGWRASRIKPLEALSYE